MDVIRYTVLPEDHGKTLKSIVLGPMGVSPTQYAKMKYAGGVTVDGVALRASQRVSAGQQVRLEAVPHPAYLPAPYDRHVDIPYEDEWLLIAYKPGPMACQTGLHRPQDTLENIIFTHLGCREDFVYRPVNRLDKGTSGLMVIAKTAHAHQLLQKQLHTPHFIREYLGIVDGCLPFESGQVDAPIGRVTGDKIRRQVTDQGRQARTYYWVEKSCGAHQLVRFCLDTGRTHQIRVHMAYLGCPLLGDYLYGQPRADAPDRFALHCHRIDLRHPITGQELHITQPLPQDLQGWL